jgi:hypothetical protein
MPLRRPQFLIIAAIVALAVTYLLGWLPERRRRLDAESRIAVLTVSLERAEERLRAGEMLGQALALKESAMRQNFGLALESSTAFFDRVRAEAGTNSDAQLRETLTAVLAKRDAVTAALAKSEPAVIDSLHAMEQTLRAGLGYPVQK